MVRGWSVLRLVGSLVAVLLLASRARAFDVTGCGQTVPPGAVGMLTVDLICDRLPQGNPPAVTLADRATLNMNGHSIIAPHNQAIFAADPDLKGGSVHMTVVGPGEIAGSDIAIEGAGPITLTNLNIHDNQEGVLNELDKKSGIVRAANVTIANSIEDPVGHGGGVGIQTNSVIANGLTVTGSTFDGFFVRRIRGTNVVASGSGQTHPVCGGLGFGIVADRVTLTNLTAQNNGSAGVTATKRVALRNSVVTGNRGEFTCNIDVYANRRPVLQNTTCGKSNGWHVCQNDSPSGAFLDPGD
jgi:hypothetical protein